MKSTERKTSKEKRRKLQLKTNKIGRRIKENENKLEKWETAKGEHKADDGEFKEDERKKETGINEVIRERRDEE